MSKGNFSLDQVWDYGGLTVTDGTAQYSTAAAMGYTIGGKAETKTAVTNGAAPTTDFNSAAITLSSDTARIVVWGLKTGGTVTVLAGPAESWDGTSYGGGGALKFPTIPVGFAPFAYSIFQATTLSSDWTFGTDNWNATNITDIHQDVVGELPNRPITTTS